MNVHLRQRCVPMPTRAPPRNRNQSLSSFTQYMWRVRHPSGLVPTAPSAPSAVPCIRCRSTRYALLWHRQNRRWLYASQASERFDHRESRLGQQQITQGERSACGPRWHTYVCHARRDVQDQCESTPVHRTQVFDTITAPAFGAILERSCCA